MTKREKTFLVVGAGAILGFIIYQNQQEKKRLQAIRQAQMMNRQGRRGGGAGRLLNTVLDLVENRKQRKGNKGFRQLTTGTMTTQTPTVFQSNPNALFQSAGINPDDPFNLGPDFGKFPTTFKPGV